MPRFFFHLRQSGNLVEDTFGVDLPNLTAVEAEARMAIADAMRDAALSRTRLQGEAFEIVDALGQPRLTVLFDVMVRRSPAGGVGSEAQAEGD